MSYDAQYKLYMKRATRWWVPSLLIVLLYSIRRLALTIVEYSADRILPYRPSFAFASQAFANIDLPRWMYSGANFDGIHYLIIAQEGYKSVKYVQAFFPVFPIFFVRPFFQLFESDTVSLFFVLNAVKICFVLFLISFFYLVRKQMGSRVAWFTILTILVFPTSIFFGALYTESLFMLLCTLVFLSAEHKRWWFAALFALIASATRVVGIALIPALIVELWVEYNKNPLPITVQKLRSFLRAHWHHLLII